MLKMRWSAIPMMLVWCVAGLACVSVPQQAVYTQPEPQPQPVMTEAAPPGAEDQPFYDDLAPLGRWVYVSGPGWTWSPYSVPAGWRPYQLGHWVFTDYGWTWASDESFGWAVYHYGRWHCDPAYGWVWVPGTEWGPAWVAWHEGGGWVGWAPLPWQVRWRADVGLDWGGVSVNVALGPSAWYFVQARDLVDPGLRYRIAPASRNVTLIQITQNVTNYTYVDNRIVDQSVRVEKIGRAVGHTIPRYRVQEADSPDSARGGRVRGEEFVVFRPNAVRGARSQGRTVPPGHDERRYPENRRPDVMQRDQAPQATPPEAASPAPASPPRGDKAERGQSRFLKAAERQRNRTRGPQPTTAQPVPVQPGPAGQEAAPPSSHGPQSGRPAAGNRGDGSTPPPGTGAVTAQPDKPGQAKAQPSRPGQAKGQSAKPKGKPVKPKQGGAADSDKAKPENSNSNN